MNTAAFDAGVASARAGATGTSAVREKGSNLSPAVGLGNRNRGRRQFGKTTKAVGGETKIPSLARR